MRWRGRDRRVSGIIRLVGIIGPIGEFLIDEIEHAGDGAGNLDIFARLMDGTAASRKSKVVRDLLEGPAFPPPDLQGLITLHRAVALVPMQGLNAGTFELRTQERFIEGRIMGDNRAGPNEIPELLGAFGKGAGVGHIRVRDPMHARGVRGNRVLRVDCRVEGVALQPVRVGLAVQRREAHPEH